MQISSQFNFHQNPLSLSLSLSVFVSSVLHFSNSHQFFWTHQLIHIHITHSSLSISCSHSSSDIELLKMNRDGLVVTAVDQSSLKKKTAVSSSWILLDREAQSTTLDVDKHVIMRRVQIHARDLRILDPMLNYPSTILGREKVIVLNLEVSFVLSVYLQNGVFCTFTCNFLVGWLCFVYAFLL